MITEEQAITLRQQALQTAVAQNPQTNVERLLDYADKVFKYLTTGVKDKVSPQ